MNFFSCYRDSTIPNSKASKMSIYPTCFEYRTESKTLPLWARVPCIVSDMVNKRNHSNINRKPSFICNESQVKRLSPRD